MTTHAEFLAAVTAAPDDDAPRLVYADWLLEQGGAEATAGEFIIAQCTRSECERTGDVNGARYRNARGREEALRPRFLAAPPHDPLGLAGAPETRISRGFVSNIGFTPDRWMALRQYPLSGVTLLQDFERVADFGDVGRFLVLESRVKTLTVADHVGRRIDFDVARLRHVFPDDARDSNPVFDFGEVVPARFFEECVTGIDFNLDIHDARKLVLQWPYRDLRTLALRVYGGAEELAEAFVLRHFFHPTLERLQVPFVIEAPTLRKLPKLRELDVPTIGYDELDALPPRLTDLIVHDAAMSDELRRELEARVYRVQVMQ